MFLSIYVSPKPICGLDPSNPGVSEDDNNKKTPCQHHRCARWLSPDSLFTLCSHQKEASWCLARVRHTPGARREWFE